MAMTPSSPMTATTASTGRFMTPVTQRSPMLVRFAVASGFARLNARDPGFGMRRPSANPSRAGSRVVDAKNRDQHSGRGSDTHCAQERDADHEQARAGR